MAANQPTMPVLVEAKADAPIAGSLVRVVGKPPTAPLPVYLADSSGVRHRLATIARGRREITVRFPKLPVDHYRLVRGRGTLAMRAVPPVGFASPGAVGCSPPSPTVGDETFGTAAGAELWALDVQPAYVSTIQKKIIFKLTRVYPDVFYAVAPDGRRVDPVWRQAHSGSNWNRPGFEWGAAFIFDVPGCWRIHAGAWPAQGDLWLVVAS